jgi:hypothetical protein
MKIVAFLLPPISNGIIMDAGELGFGEAKNPLTSKTILIILWAKRTFFSKISLAKERNAPLFNKFFPTIISHFNLPGRVVSMALVEAFENEVVCCRVCDRF